MDEPKLSYDDLKRRLKTAESALEALRKGEVDTILGEENSLVVRVAEIENQLYFQSQLLENVKESVVATDLKGNVTYWNKGAETLYGYTAEETIGHSVTSFIIDSNDEVEEKERMNVVLETGRWNGQYIQRRKDGTTFWADTVISLVRNAENEPVGFVGIDRDITKEREAAKERERLIKELRKTIAEVKTLRGILPLCSYCKNIRKDDGYWENVEIYIEEHSFADISHSICPECAKKYHPDMDLYDD